MRNPVYHLRACIGGSIGQTLSAPPDVIEDAEWLGEEPDDEEVVVRSAIKYCPPDLHAVTCN